MRLLLTTVLVTFSLTVFGGTVIKGKDTAGGASEISIDGERARFHGAKENDGYLLADFKTQKFHMVVPSERIVVEFSPGRKKTDKPKADVALEEIGEGPKVAGYATRKYELIADGKSCGFVLLSEQMTKIKDVDKLLSATAGLNPEAFMPKEMLQAFQGMNDPCVMAETELAEKHFAKLGFPMKSLDSEGKTRREVVSVEENVELEPELFELPEGYTRTTVKQMMEGMRKEMMEHSEQINEMMKEMSPEERAKMEQMMKQFGNNPN